MILLNGGKIVEENCHICDGCDEASTAILYHLYSDLEISDSDNNYDNEYNKMLYERINTGILQWVKENTVSKVLYYSFSTVRFESVAERDLFNDTWSDPIAFKLTWA